MKAMRFQLLATPVVAVLPGPVAGGGGRVPEWRARREV